MRDPRWREAFFMGWSSLLIVFVTVIVLVDGGVSSPIAAVYFLPLVFAALSYPVRSMIAVSVHRRHARTSSRARRGRRRLDHRGGVRRPHAGLRELDVRLAGAHPRAPAQRAQPRLARRPAHGRAEPPRLRGALRRRAQPRAARAARWSGSSSSTSTTSRATNDRLGHAAGDEQLRWAVAAMTATLRPSDAVGRLGGDEFAVVVPGAGPAETTALAARLHAALADGAPASLGSSSFPSDGLDADAPAPGRRRSTSTPSSTAAPKRRTATGTRELSWATTLARAVDERMAIRPRALAVGRATTPR